MIAHLYYLQRNTIFMTSASFYSHIFSLPQIKLKSALLRHPTLLHILTLFFQCEKTDYGNPSFDYGRAGVDYGSS